MRCMSTSGSGTRRSNATKAGSSSAAAANSPRTRGDVQPQPLPCETPSSAVVSSSDSSAPPTQSIFARTRTGDSGTNRHVDQVAAAVTTSENQKIQATERWSMNTPASTRPRPPPMPKVAEMRPIEEATRSRGNSSRMIPKDSGKIAPPAPCTTRPRIRTPIDGATAQTSEPSPNTASEPSSSFSLPNMSPSRPSSGVQTQDVSRNAVSSHVDASWEAW